MGPSAIALIGQSTVHVVSTSVIAVQVRFWLFLIQIVIQVWWVVGLLRV